MKTKTVLASGARIHSIWWPSSLAGKLPWEVLSGLAVFCRAEHVESLDKRQKVCMRQGEIFFFSLGRMGEGRDNFSQLRGWEREREKRIPGAYRDELEVNGCFPRANQQHLLNYLCHVCFSTREKKMKGNRERYLNRQLEARGWGTFRPFYFFTACCWGKKNHESEY